MQSSRIIYANLYSKIIKDKFYSVLFPKNVPDRTHTPYLPKICEVTNIFGKCTGRACALYYSFFAEDKFLD